MPVAFPHGNKTEGLPPKCAQMLLNHCVYIYVYIYIYICVYIYIWHPSSQHFDLIEAAGFANTWERNKRFGLSNFTRKRKFNSRTIPLIIIWQSSHFEAKILRFISGTHYGPDTSWWVYHALKNHPSPASHSKHPCQKTTENHSCEAGFRVFTWVS